MTAILAGFHPCQTCNHRALLASFTPGKRWKETLGSLLEVFPHTMQVCPGITEHDLIVLARTNTRFSHFDYRLGGNRLQFFTIFTKIEKALPFLR